MFKKFGLIHLVIAFVKEEITTWEPWLQHCSQ